MEQEQINKEEAMSEQEDISQDPNSEEFVPYTRKGVQRFRRKRGTGGITLERNNPPNSPGSSRGRGRGTRNT